MNAIVASQISSGALALKGFDEGVAVGLKEIEGVGAAVSLEVELGVVEGVVPVGLSVTVCVAVGVGVILGVG